MLPGAVLSTVSVPTSLELNEEAAEAAGCPVFLNTKALHYPLLLVFKSKQNIRIQ